VNDARVLDKEKRNPRCGRKRAFQMYMLIGGMGGQAFLLHLVVFIFCCLEMGLANVEISRRVLYSPPGTVVRRLDSVSLFSCGGTDPFELLRPIFFTYPSIITIILS
jgi:hypothetical protein